MNLYDEKTHEPVEAPCERQTFRGETVTVEGIEQLAASGSSGKVRVTMPNGEQRVYYPGVIGCYIADEPREQS